MNVTNMYCYLTGLLNFVISFLFVLPLALNQNKSLSLTTTPQLFTSEFDIFFLLYIHLCHICHPLRPKYVEQKLRREKPPCANKAESG